MEFEYIANTLKAQRAFFNSGATFSLKFRAEMLTKLKKAIEENQKDILNALRTDLGKSEPEAYMCEIGMTLSEISHIQKNLKKFATPTRVRTPLSQFASKSYTLPTPYGNTLIISPWNYPFLLTLSPLVDAIAAGNTAIVKPSAYSPATSELIYKLISKTFPRKYIAVVTGGRAENEKLLYEKFDFVFFTGSQNVGKEVLRRCAEHLTPAVLELGGKSPCIVDKSAKLALTAKRIVFGKLINCGQTCVAPDYILCHVSVKDKLVKEIIREIKKQYGENPLDAEYYGKIINKKHFDRLLSLIDKEKCVFGGDYDERALRISPTVLDGVTFDDAVMQDEIFGPILPILTFDKTEDIIEILQDKQKPLALYLFSQDKEQLALLTRRLRYGGGCVNDTIIHLATTEMGFGGVGESGMGSYHGKVGFEAFSHRKSIVNKKTFIDLPMRYAPYNEKNLKLIKKFLK